ncbi:MAG: endonuclease III domain-containing protein [Desulfobulbaceae bacterium]|jgi:endonuclease-3 related protein|nr:endonuclease III domain-containing protein [Desulfobulbaceae bacterium]
MVKGQIFHAIFDLLLAHFGPRHWWPADSPFEVVVGAVLTQNTNWQNARRAIAALKERGCLSFAALDALPVDELAVLIRPCGYHGVKAKRLKNLLAMLRREYDGDVEAIACDTLPAAREKLLAVSGIGPETADAILLYAAGHPIFVVDAYTHRVFSRHFLVPEESDYDEIQSAFMAALPANAALFNEYHALIVELGKRHCQKRQPLCGNCPLGQLPHDAGE